MYRCTIRKHHVRDKFGPITLIFVRSLGQHVEESSISPFDDCIRLGMECGGARFVHLKEFHETFEKFRFKIPSLVRMNALRTTKAGDPVVKECFGGGFSRLIR